MTGGLIPRRRLARGPDTLSAATKYATSERARGAEIRETGEEELAERLWSELQQRNQTAWSGWREPWQQSGGLLLEYAHLLTQGKRLTHLLRDQVNRRLRERRDLELDIVRIASAAGAAGGTVMIDRLQHELGATVIPENAIA